MIHHIVWYFCCCRLNVTMTWRKQWRKSPNWALNCQTRFVNTHLRFNLYLIIGAQSVVSCIQERRRCTSIIVASHQLDWAKDRGQPEEAGNGKGVPRKSWEGIEGHLPRCFGRFLRLLFLRLSYVLERAVYFYILASLKQTFDALTKATMATETLIMFFDLR
jgi:hypothetical protein